MNRTSLEIALKFTEKFQAQYPKRDLHELTEELANEIEQLQTEAKVSDDFGDILKFLNKVNNTNRAASGTYEEAHFDLTADGIVTLTVNLAGVRTVLLKTESIGEALRLMRQNLR